MATDGTNIGVVVVGAIVFIARFVEFIEIVFEPFWISIGVTLDVDVDLDEALATIVVGAVVSVVANDLDWGNGVDPWTISNVSILSVNRALLIWIPSQCINKNNSKSSGIISRLTDKEWAIEY